MPVEIERIKRINAHLPYKTKIKYNKHTYFLNELYYTVFKQRLPHSIHILGVMSPPASSCHTSWNPLCS